MQEILNILNNMDENDPNVIALKLLIKSKIEYKKVYHLQYKNKKPVMVTVTSNGNGEYCNDTTVSLNDHGEATWYTNNLLVAAYNKYVSTPWFNTDMEQCEHFYKPEDVDIVDENGKVYNTKPLTNKTIAIIKDYIQPCNRVKNADEQWLNSYANLTGYYILEECRNYTPNNPKNLDMAYKVRKRLVNQKAAAIKLNKPTTNIQKKLDKINKAIKQFGGK